MLHGLLSANHLPEPSGALYGNPGVRSPSTAGPWPPPRKPQRAGRPDLPPPSDLFSGMEGSGPSPSCSPRPTVVPALDCKCRLCMAPQFTSNTKLSQEPYSIPHLCQISRLPPLRKWQHLTFRPGNQLAPFVTPTCSWAFPQPCRWPQEGPGLAPFCPLWLACYTKLPPWVA